MDAALPFPPPGFDELSSGDQIEYLLALWTRALGKKEAAPVPDWHRQVIGERLAEYRAGQAGADRDWAAAL